MKSTVMACSLGVLLGTLAACRAGAVENVGVEATEFAVDGATLWSAGWDDQVRQWPLEGQEELQSLGGAHQGRVLTLALDRSGRRLLSGGDDGRLVVWNTRTGQSELMVQAHAGAVQVLEITRNGRWALSAGAEGVVRLWDLATGTERLSFAMNLVSAAFSGDGSHALLGGPDGQVLVWDLVAGRLGNRLEGLEGVVTAVALTPDGLRAAAGDQWGALAVWDLRHGGLQHLTHAHRGAVASMEFSPSGGAVASGGADQIVHLWFLDGRRPPHLLEGHGAAVTRVAFSARGDRLWSKARDGGVLSWNVAEMRRGGTGTGEAWSSPTLRIPALREDMPATSAPTLPSMTPGESGAGGSVVVPGATPPSRDVAPSMTPGENAEENASAVMPDRVTPAPTPESWNITPSFIPADPPPLPPLASGLEDRGRSRTVEVPAPGAPPPPPLVVRRGSPQAGESTDMPAAAAAWPASPPEPAPRERPMPEEATMAPPGEDPLSPAAESPSGPSAGGASARSEEASVPAPAPEAGTNPADAVSGGGAAGSPPAPDAAPSAPDAAPSAPASAPPASARLPCTPGSDGPGGVWEDPVSGICFVHVPAGCYRMGSDNEAEDPASRPPHKVCVDAFWISKFEITQGQWEQVMGENPSSFVLGPEYPVERVSWNDVGAFIQKLEQRAQGRERYRLPWEAEWEYACRSGGRDETYCGSMSAEGVAWFGENSDMHTHPVGALQANGLGLHDMTGNVMEWVGDWFQPDYYADSPENNPRLEVRDGSTTRVVRGGSWRNAPALKIMATRRSGLYPGLRHASVGFRLVRKGGE
ncbi:MAG: SUMF1/EgtB/PvdO family nonheme iron enzyme [Magnetococcus sp. WYHC-3]